MDTTAHASNTYIARNYASLFIHPFSPFPLPSLITMNKVIWSSLQVPLFLCSVCGYSLHLVWSSFVLACTQLHPLNRDLLHSHHMHWNIYTHTPCQHHAKEKNMFINVGKYQQRLTRKCYYSLLTLDSLRRAQGLIVFCNLVPSGKGKKVLFLTYLLLTCNGRKPLCHGHCFQ